MRAARSSAASDEAQSATARRCGRLAVVALHDELSLYPKPGLVSFVDSGSHDDMDARTFMRSLFALRSYFVDVSLAGFEGARFDVLQRLGVNAEVRMLSATEGINTHRGAIFILGLLCAAAGSLIGDGLPLTAPSVRRVVSEKWGSALLERVSGNAESKGRTAVRRYGLLGTGEEAALGFPTLFTKALPALAQARAARLDDRRTRLHVLLATIASLDDTTLAHRGGLAGLRFAQQAAGAWMARGGGFADDAVQAAEMIHHQFVSRRLSPGGSADILAAACWLERVARVARVA